MMMHKKFLLNMRENFNVGVTNLWNRLPRVVVESSSLKVGTVLCHVL